MLHSSRMDMGIRTIVNAQSRTHMHQYNRRP